MYGEAAVYEGQRDVLTIANGAWFGRGRLQEASVCGDALLALKVDRVIAVLGRLRQLSVQCQYYDQGTNRRVDIGPTVGCL